MKSKIRGRAFRLVGLILGIIAAVVSVTSIVFSAIGMRQAYLCRSCKKGVEFR